MLIEIATGNLNHRIDLVDDDLHFNELANDLNSIADKMLANGYVNPFFTPHSIPTTQEPITFVQKVQEYIVNHLAEPLPSTKELSKMFGTNEFTLKESFREILKTSIYQYYNDERLQRSYFLIQQTALPLKEVAFVCGFNEYTNFYKAFKKKYKCNPNQVLRNPV